MRELILALSLLLVSCLSTSCLHGHVDWPTVAKCGSNVTDAVAQVSGVLLQDGTDAVLSGSSTDELEQIALKQGADTLVCAIEELVRGWTSSGSACAPGEDCSQPAKDETRDAAVLRARAFLKANKTRGEFAEPPR